LYDRKSVRGESSDAEKNIYFGEGKETDNLFLYSLYVMIEHVSKNENKIDEKEINNKNKFTFYKVLAYVTWFCICTK
jgi:hypothetical protein